MWRRHRRAFWIQFGMTEMLRVNHLANENLATEPKFPLLYWETFEGIVVTNFCSAKETKTKTKTNENNGQRRRAELALKMSKCVL